MRPQITLTFQTGTDPDIAQVQVQNRLSVAEPRLPRDVVQNGIVVAKSNADFLMVVALRVRATPASTAMPWTT